MRVRDISHRSIKKNFFGGRHRVCWQVPALNEKENILPGNKST